MASKCRLSEVHVQFPAKGGTLEGVQAPRRTETREGSSWLRNPTPGALLLGVCLLIGARTPGPGLFAQTVSLELVPSATTLSGCANEELAVTLRLVNPDRMEIAGYQAFLRFPADQFEVVAYEDLLERENVYLQAPAPLGDGFRVCTENVDDPWDDGLGSDVVSVVVSVIEDDEGDGVGPITASEADLGRFVFRTKGVPSGSEGVVFRSNDSSCHVPFDQVTKVFSRQGQTIPIVPPNSTSVVVNETDPQLTFFRCEDRGNKVDLFWGFPGDESVAGVRLFRNGEQIANILLRGLTSFADEEPPVGETVYEAAILLAGELEREGCRLSCSLEFRFVRGDANGDGRVNLTDSVAILGHLFQGRPLECTDSGDFNDTGDVNLTDAVAVLDYLFRPGSMPPPPPFPEPGIDPTRDDLICH